MLSPGASSPKNLATAGNETHNCIGGVGDARPPRAASCSQARASSGAHAPRMTIPTAPTASSIAATTRAAPQVRSSTISTGWWNRPRKRVDVADGEELAGKLFLPVVNATKLRERGHLLLRQHSGTSEPANRGDHAGRVLALDHERGVAVHDRLERPARLCAAPRVLFTDYEAAFRAWPRFPRRKDAACTRQPLPDGGASGRVMALAAVDAGTGWADAGPRASAGPASAQSSWTATTSTGSTKAGADDMGSVMRIALVGSGVRPETLCSKQNHAAGIALDSGYMYWINRALGPAAARSLQAGQP